MSGSIANLPKGEVIELNEKAKIQKVCYYSIIKLNTKFGVHCGIEPQSHLHQNILTKIFCGGDALPLS